MTALKRFGVCFIILIVAFIGTKPPSTLAQATELVWTPIATGVDYAMIPAAVAGRVRGEILVVRINPAQNIFRVYYEAGRRRTIQQWARQNPGAIVIVNANFMRGNGKAVGLVKLGNDILSQPTGNPVSGQFEIRDEIPSISTLSQPQDVEPYMESFEGYPLLILQGQQVYQPVAGEKRSRRSIVAQDAQGNILFIITKPLELRLDEMIGWMASSNLNITAALNLDGGSSSQVYIASNVPALFKQGSVAVPVVLAVYAR